MIEDQTTPAPEPLPLLETEHEPEHQFSPMDIVEDGDVEPMRHWSPVNIAADGGLDSDSLGADDLPVADLTAPIQTNGSNSNGSASRDNGRRTYDTPIIGTTEQYFLDNEENIHSTPSKMPSPTRERRSSSARSVRDAGATSSPRTYPTPSPTSSLAEEQNQAREARGHQERDNDNHQPLSDPVMDPTDDHEEFDSIMESEGFTMVSLNTLPSAQQFGLGSHASRATDNAAKVLQDRDNGRIGDRLKRKLPGISDLRSDTHSSARQSPATNDLSPGPRIFPHGHQESNHSAKQSPKSHVSYPYLPPTSSPERQQSQFEEEEWAVEQAREDLVPESEATPLDDIEEENEDMEDDEEELEEVHVLPHSSEIEQQSSPQNDSTDVARSQQEAQWHEERQIVSRHAQNASDSNRVIYIDSDENVSEDEGSEGYDAFEDHFQSDFGPIVEEEPEGPHELEEVEELREPAEQSEPTAPENFEQFGEEDEDFVGFEGSDDVGQLEPEPVLSPSPAPAPATTRTSYVETEVSEGEDDRYDDIWRQEPEYPALEKRHLHEPEPTANHEAEAEDEDDAFDDIWQQEARDNSYLSQHSDNHLQKPTEDAISPWREIAVNPSNKSQFSSSPAYVNLEKDDLRHLNPTQIRRLREREVDLSALLAADDTPNRARYYNGTSTPRSILRSARQHSSTNGSAIKSDSSRKPEKRVRLQPLSQSPEREPEAEQESPVFRHNYSQQEPLSDNVEEVSGNYDDISHEAEPAPGDVAATPELQRQTDVEPQGSSWFQRITSLTPRWLKAPPPAHDDDSSSVSEEDPGDVSEEELEDGQMDQGELSIQSPREHHQYHEYASHSDRSSQSPLEVQDTSAPAVLKQGYGEAVHSVEEEEEKEEEEGEGRSERSIADESVENDPVNLSDNEHDSLKGPRPLAVFGYFSNDHYLALRRVYRMAKRHPERLPYYDAPGRAQIIGDWIWTSDGLHGVPISEAQFAIIDRFVHELSHADVQYGGSGQVEWTDADLHRRLISIIIGEQIREERKVQANRGASVDTWR